MPRIQVLEVRREEPVPGRHEFRRTPCPQIQRCVRKQSAWTTWKCPVQACRGGCSLAAAVTQHTQQLQSLTRLAAPTPRSQQAGSRASMLGTVAHSTLRIYGRQERDRRRQIRTRHCLAPSALSILTTWRRFGLGQLLLLPRFQLFVTATMSDRMSPGEDRESAVEEKTLSMLEQLGASGVFFCAGAAVRAGRVSRTGALRSSAWCHSFHSCSSPAS